MQAVDSIDIDATPERVFNTVLDYPNVHTWFSGMRCTLITEGEIGEGSRIAHTFYAPLLELPTRFVRTIRRLEAPSFIEETYDEGALVGTGMWTFARLPSGLTRATYACTVRSNDLATHVGFALSGATLHKVSYARLLAALKRNCE